MSLKIGDTLPEFTLTDQTGASFNSASVKGKTAVVIYFYPKNFTPGCNREACLFRDSYEDFTDMGVEVIGISSDSEESHRKFSKRYKLPFTLLSDSKNKVRRKFGVKKGILGLLPGRETFVFNKNGELTFKFEALGADPHIKKAIAHLKKSA
ncbi:MAG: peroxiredoxin [Flavobacteriaceae bacterium]|nr:peroxiredoxin [Flavobacteriaceae bacterium]